MWNHAEGRTGPPAGGRPLLAPTLSSPSALLVTSMLSRQLQLIHKESLPWNDTTY